MPPPYDRGLNPAPSRGSATYILPRSLIAPTSLKPRGSCMDDLQEQLVADKAMGYQSCNNGFLLALFARKDLEPLHS